MNDSPQWQSPAAPSAGQDHSGYPAPPPPFGTQAEAGAPTAQPSVGWAPPPKPGLIPLRPLDFGTLLGAAFKTMRHNPKATFGAALLVQGGVSVITVGIIGLVTFLTLSRLDTASTANRDDIAAGSVAAIALSAIVPVLLSLAASALLQGVIVLDVMRAALGEKPSLGTLLRMAKGRIWAVIGWTLLVLLAAGIAVGLIVGIVVALSLIGGVAGAIFAVLFGAAGGIGFVIIWVWLSTKLSLVPSVLMAERVGLRTAVARSWALTRRAFWKTFGIELLVAAIIGIATQIVTTPISFLSGMVISLADPNGQNPATSIAGALVLYGVLIVVSVLFGAIGSVIQSATAALIYIDLRMRKEALDLDLARFVEARQSGTTGLGNPYLHHAKAQAEPAGGTAAYSAPAPQWPAPTSAPIPPSSESPWT
ncbi:hypothetical protein [Parafrigoribacterium soli]|uniref:hypothetical protein n=1 Tax=Parafrigoribacterium soli TaxID=3144663 RepID=UPI0032EB61A4